jgi:hypothetical protein
MRKTPIVLAITIALSAAGPLAADNHDSDESLKLAIHHVKVKMGHGMAFRAGMEAYSACLAENDYDESYSVWHAVDGDRTGYHIVSSFKLWGEFDEDDDASSECWQKEGMRAGVFDHLSSWETQYAERLSAWSGDMEGSNVVKLHNFRVDDNSDFRSVVSEITTHLKEADYEHMGTWYEMLSGGYWGADYFVVDHFENFAAMDEDRKGVNGVLTEVLGEDRTGRVWDAFREALEDDKGYWTFMLERRESMGYSADD